MVPFGLWLTCRGVGGGGRIYSLPAKLFLYSVTKRSLRLSTPTLSFQWEEDHLWFPSSTIGIIADLSRGEIFWGIYSFVYLSGYPISGHVRPISCPWLTLSHWPGAICILQFAFSNLYVAWQPGLPYSSRIKTQYGYQLFAIGSDSLGRALGIYT